MCRNQIQYISKRTMEKRLGKYCNRIEKEHLYIQNNKFCCFLLSIILTAPPAVNAANILTTYRGLGSIYIATTLSAHVPASRNSDANDSTLSCVSRYDQTLPDTASIRHGALGDLLAWAWNASCTIGH